LEKSIKKPTEQHFRKRQRRRRRRCQRKGNSLVIQEHHITYTPEYTVKVYKGEHWIITQMQRRKNWSKGAITAMRYILNQAENKAVDLEPG